MNTLFNTKNLNQFFQNICKKKRIKLHNSKNLIMIFLKYRKLLGKKRFILIFHYFLCDLIMDFLTFYENFVSYLYHFFY